MVAFLPIVAAGIGLAGIVGKAIARKKANKQLKGLAKQDPIRQRNKDVDTQYAMAQQLLNANDPYEQQAQQAAVTRFGNVAAANAKAATSGAQLIAANSAAEGQLAQDQAEINEGSQDAYYQNLALMQQATQARQMENDAMFQDEVRRFDNKGQIEGAISQNRASTWGDIGNFGMGLAGLGISAKANGVDVFGRKPSTERYSAPAPSVSRVSTGSVGSVPSPNSWAAPEVITSGGWRNPSRPTQVPNWNGLNKK